MPSIGKRIRDVERLLRKYEGNDDMKEKLSSDLQTLMSEQQQSHVRLKQKEYAIKYHKAKFFERKKVLRTVNSVENEMKRIRELLKNGHFETIEKLGILDKLSYYEDLQNRLIRDLAYILYYPKEMKYISLFGQRHSLEEDNETTDFNESSERIKSAIVYEKLRSIHLDHVSLKNQERAKSLALSFWDEDKKKGRDLVQNAILVQYGKIDKDSVSLNPKSILHESKQTQISNSQNHCSETQAKGQARKKQRLMKEYGPTPPDNSPTNLQDNPDAPSSSQNLITDVNINSLNDMDSKINFVEDPFFNEPVIVTKETLTQSDNSKMERRHQSRSLNMRKGTFKSLESIDTTGMSKQEIRLLEWKKKRARNRKF